MAIFVILLLILINALFVAGEFAAVAVPHARVQEMAQKKHLMARALWPILNNNKAFDNYIAACQVGITLSSLMLGAYGQVEFGKILRPLLSDVPQAEWLIGPGILILLTAFQMVLGELLPKSLSLQYPLKSALWTTYPIRFAVQILRLPIWILNGSGSVLLQALGFRHASHHHILSPEEISLMLTEGEKQGFLDTEENERMQKALKISEWSIRKLMVPRSYLETIDLNAPLDQALQTLRESQYSTLLVYKGDPEHIEGYLSPTKVLHHILTRGEIQSFDDFVTPILALPRSLGIQKTLEKFKTHQTRLALVVNEHGTIVGLITLKDILMELTGSIASEFSSLTHNVETLDDGRLRVPALLYLEELSSLGICWPSEDPTTVAGYIKTHLDTLPKPGLRIQMGACEVEIETVSQGLIQSVLIRRGETQ